MRIVNWNVNSIRARKDRVIDLLDRLDVDVLLMQETKTKDFPPLEGYEVAHWGLNQWNGVAIASRVGLEDVRQGFANQPSFNGLEARAISATCGGVRVESVYVPNGREIAHPHYDYKLRFLYALKGSNADVIGGDFNVAPLDRHVWDINAFAGETHVTEPERQAFDALLEKWKVASPWEGFSFWDYRAGRYERNEGMLIDFQLSNLEVERAFIDGERSSDHAPVVVDYRGP